MRTIFITGASAGLGRGLALRYAARGDRVFLCARRADQLEAVAEACRAAHPEARAAWAVTDGTRAEAVQSAFEQCVEAFGAPDTVIANAGAGLPGRADALTVEDWRSMFDLNFFGVLHTLYPALEGLARQQGRFAVVGSVNSYLSLPTAGPYCASKSAVRSLADSLYAELGSSGVSVTLLTPGLFESELRRKSARGQDAEDPAPRFLVARTDAVVAQAFGAIEGRRREQIITWHAWGLLWVQALLRGPLLWGLRRFAPGDQPA